MFDVASPLLSSYSGSKTCLFCDLVTTAKVTRSVSVIETLKKPRAIEQEWSKVKPVKIKDLDTKSEDYKMTQVLLQQRSLKDNQRK